MASHRFGSWSHLAGRFFGALSPAGPAPSDEAWALGSLLEGEQLLWGRMSGPDRRHAVGVARETVRLLGPETPSREVVAAALLHDVGKVESGLGTFARVGVTLAAMAAGRTRLLDWAGSSAPLQPPSWRVRVGMYLAHDRLGADLLRQAGSDELTFTWAREHHLAPSRWTVDNRVGSALKAADGD
jgi:HD domain